MIKYTVTVFPPQGEDDYNWTINIGRNGMTVGSIKATMLPAMDELGELIMKHAEEESQ